MVNVLLLMTAASQSPLKAQACTVFPPFCLIGFSGMKLPIGRMPVSSSKFAPGGYEQIFAFIRLALGNSPIAVVLLGEIRTAGMGKQDLKDAVLYAIH